MDGPSLKTTQAPVLVSVLKLQVAFLWSVQAKNKQKKEKERLKKNKKPMSVCEWWAQAIEVEISELKTIKGHQLRVMVTHLWWNRKLFYCVTQIKRYNH